MKKAYIFTKEQAAEALLEATDHPLGQWKIEIHVDPATITIYVEEAP